MGILILQKIQFSNQLRHFHSMFLPRILQSSQSNIFSHNKIFHISVRTVLFFRTKIMKNINFFDFIISIRLFLLFFFILFELLISYQRWSMIILVSIFPIIFIRIFRLDFFDKFFDFEIITIFLGMVV